MGDAGESALANAAAPKISHIAPHEDHMQEESGSGSSEDDMPLAELCAAPAVAQVSRHLRVLPSGVAVVVTTHMRRTHGDIFYPDISEPTMADAANDV